MTEELVVQLGSGAVWVAMLVAAPVLGAALLTGLLVSIFQAATQINEQTLTFIPKILAMTVALVLTGPWVLETMLNYTVNLLNGIPTVTK